MNAQYPTTTPFLTPAAQYPIPTINPTSTPTIEATNEPIQTHTKKPSPSSTPVSEIIDEAIGGNLERVLLWVLSEPQIPESPSTPASTPSSPTPTPECEDNDDCNSDGECEHTQLSDTECGGGSRVCCAGICCAAKEYCLAGNCISCDGQIIPMPSPEPSPIERLRDILGLPYYITLKITIIEGPDGKNMYGLGCEIRV